MIAIPPGSALRFAVETFVDEDGAPITDAVMQGTLYSGGVAVEGCSAIALSGDGQGNYEGFGTPTNRLTVGASYTVRIVCTNYKREWGEDVICLESFSR